MVCNRRLDEAIAELVDEAQTSGFPTVFHLVGKSLPIDSKSALALYRVAQEGLTNISKHAQATHTEVTLDFSQTAFVRLTLIDDGVGAAKTRSGFGLVGIQERVQLLGGEFNVETQVGRGFRLEVTIPVGENL